MTWALTTACSEVWFSPAGKHPGLFPGGPSPGGPHLSPGEMACKWAVKGCSASLVPRVLALQIHRAPTLEDHDEWLFLKLMRATALPPCYSDSLPVPGHPKITVIMFHFCHVSPLGGDRREVTSTRRRGKGKEEGDGPSFYNFQRKWGIWSISRTGTLLTGYMESPIYMAIWKGGLYLANISFI